MIQRNLVKSIAFTKIFVIIVSEIVNILILSRGKDRRETMRTYLKDLRKEAKMNQTQVATQLGMTQTNYSSIENGKTKNIAFKTLMDLSKIFGTKEDTLFTAEMRYIAEKH